MHTNILIEENLEDAYYPFIYCPHIVTVWKLPPAAVMLYTVFTIGIMRHGTDYLSICESNKLSAVIFPAKDPMFAHIADRDN